MKKNVFLVLLLSAIMATGVWALCETVSYDDGIYHIVIPAKVAEKRLKFVVSEKLMTNSEAHLKSGARLTVNAGFFDPKNQKTISYIVSEENTAADPLLNENILNNPILRKNLDKIINRSEFRAVDCDGETHFEITPHSTPVDFACSIMTSAQGGPMILPDLKLEEEFFILKENGKIIRESASVLEKTPRTVIALKGQEIHILVITDKNPMTIYEVKDLCTKLGFDYAMGFDGGSSTSMNYKDKIEVVSTGDDNGRMLKSFLILK